MNNLFFVMISIILLVACSGKKSAQPVQADGSGQTEVSREILEDEVRRITDGRYLFSINNQNAWGIKNDTGTVVLEPIYGKITLENGMFIVTQHNSSIGVFDMEGEMIIEPGEYTDVAVEPQFISVSSNHAHGVFSRYGDKFTDIEYTEVISFPELFIVRNENECRALDYKGSELLPEGVTDVYYKGKTGKDWFNVYTTEKAPEILVYKTAANKFGVNNFEGEVIIPAEYDCIEVHSNHYETTKFKKTRVLDLKGQPISGFYHQILETSQGYIVKNNNLYGFIDKTGKELLSVKYRNIISINIKWLVVVNDEGKKALFNQQGARLLDFEYDNIIDADRSEKDYFATVEQNNQYGIFDGKRFILPIKFEDICYDHLKNTPYWVVKQDGKLGLFEISGKAFIPCLFSSISLINGWNDSKSFLAMSKGDSFGLYSLRGKFIREIKAPIFYAGEGGITSTWEEEKQLGFSCWIKEAYLVD